MDSTSSAPISAFFLVAGLLYAPVAIFAVQVRPNVSLFNLATFIPATAALILVYHQNNGGAVRQLLKRAFDFRRIESKVWYFPVLLLYPSIVLVQYGVALAFSVGVPSPTVSVWIPLTFIVLFIAAAGEELGWMGYLFDPMEVRFGTLKGAVLNGRRVAGVSHSAVHIERRVRAVDRQPAYLHRSDQSPVDLDLLQHREERVRGDCDARDVQPWLAVLPPRAGLLVPTFYDPRNLALSTLLIVAVVLLVWEPSLARYKYAKTGGLPG